MGGSIGAILAVGIPVAVLVIAVLMYNGLVRGRTLVNEGWSGIDAQLKRRADLIPNLVETVKGYATHEKTTLDELVRLRAGAGASGDVAARSASEQQITAAIGKLIAVAEAYPDLKANQNFQNLSQQLGELEDQIQLARRYYNGAVRNYNVSVGQFPGNLVAGMFSFHTAQFFELENEGDRATPKVSFS